MGRLLGCTVFIWGLLAFAVASPVGEAGGRKIRLLIIDGQNNHSWKLTTPILKKALEDSGRFVVEVATSPAKVNKPSAPKKPKDPTPENLAKYQDELAKLKDALEKYEPLYKAYREEMEKFQPDLSKYDVVLSNYNGDKWSAKLSADLDELLKAGKIGLVIVHAANNSFTNWKEYDLMIGMGWRGAGYGERLKLDDAGKTIRVPPGKDGSSSHGYTGQFNIVIRDPDHPITKGMPLEWVHARDELYDNMRGPIENVHLLATAYSPRDPAKKLNGTVLYEPMIWTVSYGKGRVFHTPMGHDVNAMKCVGFQATLQRGAEWAATGNVTIALPPNFPTEKKISVVK